MRWHLIFMMALAFLCPAAHAEEFNWNCIFIAPMEGKENYWDSIQGNARFSIKAGKIDGEVRFKNEKPRRQFSHTIKGTVKNGKITATLDPESAFPRKLTGDYKYIKLHDSDKDLEKIILSEEEGLSSFGISRFIPKSGG